MKNDHYNDTIKDSPKIKSKKKKIMSKIINCIVIYFLAMEDLSLMEF